MSLGIGVIQTQQIKPPPQPSPQKKVEIESPQPIILTVPKKRPSPAVILLTDLVLFIVISTAALFLCQAILQGSVGTGFGVFKKQLEFILNNYSPLSYIAGSLLILLYILIFQLILGQSPGRYFWKKKLDL